MSPQQSIAHYRIVSKLGEGGMGEVWRATDTKLNREVAIKILPEAFANNSDRLQRFHREAQVLASLNHPNIAAIYGVEERALVMELVEGASPKGPMTFDDAWKIASQIASALEYAHDKGIVHRDLKPDNIKITADGLVKLLDFGLAKAFTEQREPSANVEQSPTLTIGATEAGVLLGTAAYMAPEQARGKSVDKRADIWAFGVTLYELLTGERLFKGDDVADTLAQVLTKEPDLGRVPVRVQRLLRRCLQNDPKQRLRDIGEAQYLLEEWPQAKTRASKLPWVVAAVFAGIGIAIIQSFLYFHHTPPVKTVQRYSIELPENTTNLNSLAISPDGRLVVMAARVKGKLQLWLRARDALQAQPLPGTEYGGFPFWSPDSRYIGFFAEGKLKKIAATGGPAQSLCDAPSGRGGSWSRDDVIIFSPVSGEIRRVSAAGGVPEDVMKRKGLTSFPVFLPDGKHFLYLIFGGSVEQNGVYLGSLDGKGNRRVLTDVSSVSFAANTLLFVRENALMAQPFDPAQGQPSAEAIPLAENISTNLLTFYAPVTASETGVLLYEGLDAIAAGNFQLASYDRSGKPLALVGAPGIITVPVISPDEKSVAFRRRSGSQTALWIRDLTRGVEQRFTTVFSDLPMWSPNGDHIAFSASSNGGIFNLYQKEVGGTGQDELLLATGTAEYMSQWSRDGRFIVYRENSPKTKWDVWVLPMNGGAERKPIAFLHSESNEVHPQLSPDSRWMAYTSDESGRREVYVRPFPGGEIQRQISIAGGEQPRWKGDGRELFFVSGNGKMMAVAVKTMADKKTFEVGAPQPLFDAQLAPGPLNPQFAYDVTSDGKRFLLVTNAAVSASAPLLKVIVNWDIGLKK